MDELQLTIYSVAIPFLLSVVLGWLFIPRVLILSHRKQLYDMPDQRKMHHTPVPRLGGITFLPILLIVVCMSLGVWVMMRMPYNSETLDDLFTRFILLFVGMMVLFLVGVVDDLIGVSYKAKFLTQIISAVLFPISGLWIHDLSGLFWINEIPTWVGILLTIFVVVYVTNAINLIDGVDGLAAGICFVSLLTLGLAAMVKGQYMASGAGITFPREMLIIGLSTMFLPMFDIVRVVIVRVRNHCNPFLPDKNHIHHKLLRTGISSRCVMTVLVFVSLLLVLATMMGVFYHLGTTFVFLIDVLLWLVFDSTVNYYIRKNHRKRYE